MKPLAETNKYLKNKELRELLVERAVITSTAIENGCTEQSRRRLIEIRHKIKELMKTVDFN